MLILIYIKGGKTPLVKLYLNHFKKMIEAKAKTLTINPTVFPDNIDAEFKNKLNYDPEVEFKIIKLLPGDESTLDWLKNNTKGVKLEPPVIIDHEKGKDVKVYPLVEKEIVDEIYLITQLEKS